MRGESRIGIVLFKTYDSMMGKPISRDAVRKAYFYATPKIKGQRPSGFADDEIESWATDATAMLQVSAEEYKRQIEKYGDVSLSRLPNETNVQDDHALSQEPESPCHAR